MYPHLSHSNFSCSSGGKVLTSSSVVSLTLGVFMMCCALVLGMEISIPASSSAFACRCVSLCEAVWASSDGKAASSANSISEKITVSVV